MDDLAREVVKQVPALAVLVFVVIQFLRYLGKIEDSRETHDATYAEILKAEREVYERRHGELMGAVAGVGEALCDARGENADAHKETRHAVRDLAHAAGLARAAREGRRD